MARPKRLGDLRAGRRAAGWLTCLLALSLCERASAFCRTDTCEQDQDNPDCGVDPTTGCLAGGKSLYWNRGCFSFSVHASGSPKRHISYEQAVQTIGEAMAVWSNAQCSGGELGIDAVLFPAVVCERAEYNTDGPNANLWVFRDDRWPYDDDGRTLALTLVTFNVNTGEIYDADVEVNSAVAPLSGGEASLAEIATHEAGHVYGLAHTSDTRAIMYANYSSYSGIPSALTADDLEGICAIYPPGSGPTTCNPTPRHGFSTQCGRATGGCALGPLTGSPRGSWAASLGAVLGLLFGRRSRVRRAR